MLWTTIGVKQEKKPDLMSRAFYMFSYLSAEQTDRINDTSGRKQA